MVAKTGLPAWLALARVPGLGAVGIGALLDRLGTPDAVFGASGDELSGYGLRASARAAIRDLDWACIQPDLNWLSAGPGRQCLTLHDKAYPRLLAETAGAPPILFVDGDPACLSDPQLAIVGSRNPSPDGLAQARSFAQELSAYGILVTSGLAAGIDGAAHQAALSAGGRTVAVLGTGIDRIYPERHRRLAASIREGGALVSEFPVGTPPRAEYFPRRNRIISGLAMGTLVVEATQRSGSLITARCCAEQGRELFAIPGSIRNPLTKGCHRLIRDGAKLTETVEDILEELSPLAGVVLKQAAEAAPDMPCADSEHDHVLNEMGFAPISLDDLCMRSEMSAARLSSILLLLEMENRVISVPGGLYLRCKRQGSL